MGSKQAWKDGKLCRRDNKHANSLPGASFSGFSLTLRDDKRFDKTTLQQRKIPETWL